MNFDLTDHEVTRRAHVYNAIPGWTEVEIQADEVKAWKHLFSDLDDHQLEVYQMMTDQGLLPRDL